MQFGSLVFLKFLVCTALCILTLQAYFLESSSDLDVVLVPLNFVLPLRIILGHFGCLHYMFFQFFFTFPTMIYFFYGPFCGILFLQGVCTISSLLRFCLSYPKIHFVVRMHYDPVFVVLLILIYFSRNFAFSFMGKSYLSCVSSFIVPF